jgi:hypothetical protein
MFVARVKILAMTFCAGSPGDLPDAFEIYDWMQPATEITKKRREL